MSYNIDSVIKHLISQNNHNLNIAFPAVVVGVEKLKDGFVDVQPIVEYMNPLTSETSPYPVIHNVRLIFPSNNTSTICFPVNQGDFVELRFQSVDIQNFINGNKGQHPPDFLSFGNLKNVVASVGMSPYQDSCFNPSNFTDDLDLRDLNIVHNKNTDAESRVVIKSSGDILLKSPTRVVVESKEVQVVSDRIDAKSAVISTQGDVEIEGKSVKMYMQRFDTHTHTGNKGLPTSAPTG